MPTEMVKVLTPAYGTALNYGLGIKVVEPFYAAAVYASQFRREALLHLTAQFLGMGIDSGHSIDGIVTHTMRCSKNFVPHDKVAEFNQAGVAIARDAREKYGRKEGIVIFGDMSVMGDCYSGESRAQSLEEAVEYHREQATILKDAGVDGLWAETVGNLLEAQAFALVASELDAPLYISVVLNPEGSLLDGTRIEKLVQQVDEISRSRPQGYLTNCSWETSVRAMYERARETKVLHRLRGFYNNGSCVDHTGKQELTAVKRYENIHEYLRWIKRMISDFPHLREEQEIWVSGCCGIGADDINTLLTEMNGSLGQDKPQR